LKAYGVDDRCSVVEGNFFKSAPGGADTYLFRHIIHDWTDEQSVQILNNCRKVIPNNGTREEKFVALVHLYAELRLPFDAALDAAEADLLHEENRGPKETARRQR
jgi:O-methyltransferase domain